MKLRHTAFFLIAPVVLLTAYRVSAMLPEGSLRTLRIAIVSGNNQQISRHLTIGDPQHKVVGVAHPLTIVVRNGEGRPANGVPIQWTRPVGFGVCNVSPGSTVTDETGQAHVDILVNEGQSRSSPVPCRVRASNPSMAPVFFDLTVLN